LIYGPIGIAGMAVGEFLVDIFYYLSPHGNIGFDRVIQSFTYFLLVFFLCYFNYKLYYTFNFKNKQASLRLNNVKNLTKFVLVSIILFAFNLYLITYVDYKIFNNPGDMFWDIYHGLSFLITLNLVSSLLIMSGFSLFNLKVYKPKKSKLFINHSRTFNILIFISSIALIIQIICMIRYNPLNYINITTILWNVILIMLFVICKPITEDIKAEKVNNSFNELIVFIFMLIYTIFWVSGILLDFIEDKYSSSFNVADFISHHIGPESVIKLVIVLIFLSIMLWYIQNNFSKSLHSLYKVTKNYAMIKFGNISNMSNENNDIEDMLYNLKDLSNEKYEVGPLANSVKQVIEDNKVKSHALTKISDMDNDSKDIEDILRNLKDLSNEKYEVGQLADSLKDMIEDNELYTINLEKLVTEKEKIVAELNIASEIQNSVIPNIFPPFPDRLNDFDIYASFNPARNVGGDFYDYFLIDDDHLVLVIGDVSGKGVPAALFMMITKSLISYLIRSGLSLSEAFYQLNNQLLENNTEEMFVTAWLGILEISSGKLIYVNAGHNLPYLFSKSTNQYDILEAKPNFVLGGLDNINYIHHEVKIKEGDRLYLYTDGITETINQNVEEFSNERLLNILNNKNHYSIKDLILEINNEVHNFGKNMKQFDDETMLLLEYRRKNI
jgi:serine phosphatase RsbU (regulator of sigma subunit)